MKTILHHIRKDPKNNYLLWNLAIQIYTTGSYQLPMLSINLFNRDYTCLSMAEQNIKPFMHNAFFSNLDDVWACFWKQLLFCIRLLLLKHESSGTQKRGKNSCSWITGSYFQIPRTISLVPHRILQGWTQSLPIEAPQRILGIKTWTKIPYVLWKSLTWMKIRSFSLQLSTKNVK